MKRKLKKSADRTICGVCGGIAECLDIDPTIVRIVTALLGLCGGGGVLIYLVMALIMPSE